MAGMNWQKARAQALIAQRGCEPVNSAGDVWDDGPRGGGHRTADEKAAARLERDVVALAARYRKLHYARQQAEAPELRHQLLELTRDQQVADALWRRWFEPA